MDNSSEMACVKQERYSITAYGCLAPAHRLKNVASKLGRSLLVFAV
ncbi:hypothetical protein BofuT4_P096350.1 [Botrytis cinerea T4]|uniref:Uncharacterized protein n=1 Tax=Botryotinia fuckeliana (strain T4) TaxID=999810 RepID=G2YDS9_BOTF4|nr:hypothetical protein BofuT4_P096350.1 [Botrytis cinerea T4]